MVLRRYEGQDKQGVTFEAHNREAMHYKGTSISTAECKFYRALKNAKTAMTGKELGEAAGIGGRSQRRFVARWVDQGVLTRVNAYPAVRWKLMPDEFSSKAQVYFKKIEDKANKLGI